MHDTSRARRVSTTRDSSTTPAASRSSPTSRACASHELVHTGLVALTNLEHRGATGAEPDTGDGAGILVQVPDRFLRAVVGEQWRRAAAGRRLRRRHGVPARRPGGRREGPGGDRDDRRRRGPRRRSPGATCPSIRAASAPRRGPRCRRSSSSFITDPAGATGIDLDRKAFLARKRIEHELDPEFATYFPSLSSRTLVYKGMLTTPQLAAFFPDLLDERFESALLLVHSRFSTNTFPSWPLAHPYRYVAHNGEINTVQGNQNWMRAREAMLDGSVLPGHRAGLPDLHARRVRHRPLRRGARAAPPRRPADPPRRADDDPRGVGEQRRDGPRAAGLLPVPLLA